MPDETIPLPVGNIEPIEIQEEMERSFLDYAMSVITSRALPDARDGLKPVQRRILYGMYDQGMRPDRQHRKCANAVGHVMAVYHPHVDSAIYDALARMAQDFSLRYPLIDGHGNFGSPDPNDRPAAQRWLDAHIIAIDAKTGKLRWNTEVAKPEAGYAITHAPLVVKDKVIVGTAGGEYGIRGFIAAYDVRTGTEAWRFNTIPGPGEPGHETWGGDSWQHGGASVWVTGSYDADLNLTYWGVGNPGPDWTADLRPGDNLYSDCVVTLDPDTGKLKWYFQFTPHDDFDFELSDVTS